MAKGRAAKYKLDEANQLILPHIATPTLFQSQVILELISSYISALTSTLSKYLDERTHTARVEGFLSQHSTLFILFPTML